MKCLLVFFFTLNFGTAMAQESYLKAGANLNLPVLMHGITSVTEPPFVGLNISYEKLSGRHLAFVLNIEGSRRSTHMDPDFNPGIFEKSTTTQFSLLPEIRMYPGKSKGQGFFLQAGLPLLSYNLYSTQTQIPSIGTFGQTVPEFDVLFTGNMDLAVPFGFGLKYPFKTGTGMEMNFSTDLASLLNREKFQTFQVGIKYFWQHKK